MAFFKGSAYEFTALFQDAPFKGMRSRRIREPEPILEHTVELKQRLDSLAHDYFAQSRDWRWLVEANRDVLFPEDLLWRPEEEAEPDDGAEAEAEPTGREHTGRVILIPRRTEEI